MEMFSDLRQFDEAKTWAEEYAASKGGDTGIVQEFVHRQAEWAEEVSDYDSAATMYLQAKKFDKAIAILDSGHSGPVKKRGCEVARGQRIRGPFVHELAGLLVFETRRAGRWADSAICWPLLVKNAGSVWPVFRSS